MGGIVADEAEQGRASGVLPWQAEEVQAGDIGDAAAVDNVPVTGYARDVDPGVVRAVTGRPDHGAGVQAAADDEIGPGSQSAAHPGLGGDPHQAEPGEPPEQVLARPS